MKVRYRCFNLGISRKYLEREELILPMKLTFRGQEYEVPDVELIPEDGDSPSKIKLDKTRFDKKYGYSFILRAIMSIFKLTTEHILISTLN